MPAELGHIVIGAQVPLFPMTSEFVDVITSVLDGLAPYRDRLRFETDDMLTLMVGAPEPLLDAIRDLFAGAARHPEHVTMHATPVETGASSQGCLNTSTFSAQAGTNLMRRRGQMPTDGSVSCF